VLKYNLDVLRFDFNVDPAPYWWTVDFAEPSRRGVTEALYVEGVLTMWDELRARHPGLILDNCASGGRRLDLETMSRSVSLWRSDFTSTATQLLDHSALQSMTMGLTRWLPVNSGGMGSDVSPYAWRSAGVAGKALVWGQGGWDAVTKSQAGQSVDVGLPGALTESRRLAAVVEGGADFWALTPVTPDDSIWAAYQLAEADGSAGFVMVFRRSNCTTHAAETFPLLGLLPARDYQLELYYNYSLASTSVVHSSTLMGPGGGLKVALPTPGSSVLVEYTLASRAVTAAETR